MVETSPEAWSTVSLQHYVDVLRRRRWTILTAVAVVVAAGWIATAMMTPVYEAKARLLVRTSAATMSGSSESPLGSLLAGAQPEPLDTQLAILKSRPFLRRVFRSVELPPDRRGASVSSEKGEGQNIVAVSVHSAYPETAAIVANAVLDQYLLYTRQHSLSEIVRARRFVEREEEKARRALQSAEDALLAFRRQNRVAQLTAEQQSRTQAYIGLETQTRAVESDTTGIQAQIRSLRAQLAREPRELRVMNTRENPRVPALEAKIAELSVERAVLLQSYQPGSQRLRPVDAQLAVLRAQLAAEPIELRSARHVPNGRHEQILGRLQLHEAELTGLAAQQSKLRSQLAEQSGRMNQLGPWEVRLAQLQRDAQMAEQSYLSLAGRLQDLRIRENARLNLARIIERAGVPGAPTYPQKQRNLALALVAGLLLGCSLAFLLEFLDDRITVTEEVDRLLALPGLGYIPAMVGGRRLIHALPPQSPISESYRGLRSSINFSTLDTPLATLAVTSAGAGEGKSTTAANLALSMAHDGRRVILVDADLHRPSLHRLLGIEQTPGLFEVLKGDCSLDEALRPVPGEDLLVLPSGEPAPNPAELLNTPAMEHLLRELTERTDLVVFDSPPCVLKTDARVLGAKLDGVLLVAEMGETRKAELRRARSLLDQAHIRILGVVFNKMKSIHGVHWYRYSDYRGYPGLITNGNGNGNGNGYVRRATAEWPGVVGRPGGEARPRAEASGKDDEEGGTP
jgi:capsular exopolysaccharide synthesis family protein